MDVVDTEFEHNDVVYVLIEEILEDFDCRKIVYDIYNTETKESIPFPHSPYIIPELDVIKSFIDERGV
jgi:hypothetical protein